jgi:ribosomal protein L37AE/L43A
MLRSRLALETDSCSVSRMANVIEESKSSRATCRTCKQKIDKGVLRFGEETPNQFNEGETSYFWHHLTCAAGKKPALVKDALAAFTGTVPDRAALEAQLASAKPKAAAGERPYPFAERAATGRSKCMQCDEAIEKGALRIAVEREVDTGAFVRKGPGYLHIGCAMEHTGDDELLAQVKKNTPELTPVDVDELTKALTAEA